jgi:hypothetical protein
MVLEIGPLRKDRAVHIATALAAPSEWLGTILPSLPRDLGVVAHCDESVDRWRREGVLITGWLATRLATCLLSTMSSRGWTVVTTALLGAVQGSVSSMRGIITTELSPIQH